MGVVRTIARNVFSNFAGYFVSMVVGFLLTPYVMEVLGKDKWGLWQAIVAFTGSYGLCDLGIRSAVGHYVTRYWAQRDLEGVNRTFATALVITTWVAIFLALVTTALAFVSPLLFESGMETNEMRTVILIMGIGVSLNFPLAIFGSATYARQRFDIANTVGISERITTALLYVWVLESGWGLVGVASIAAASPTMFNVARIWIAFKLLPGLELTKKLVKLTSVKELFSFGFYNVLVNAADQIVLNSDALIIAIVLNSTATAYYSGGSFVIAQSIALINAFAWTLTPYATKCDTEGDTEALRRLWMTGTRMVVLLGALIASGMILLGEDFLFLWIKPKELGIVRGDEYTSSAVIMAILAGTVYIRAAMSCGKQILFGIQEVKFLAKNSIATAILNVVLSCVLIYWFGLIGVAISSVFAFALMQLWFQPKFLSKCIDKSVWAFMVPTLWIPTVVFGTMWGMELLVCDYIHATSWSSFVAKGFALATPAAILGFWLGTSHVEKDKLRAFLKRIGRGLDPFTGRRKNGNGKKNGS